MDSIKIAEIKRSSLESLEDEDTAASITDVKQLSSYNWIETSSAAPTIAIPGCPPRWSPPKSPQQRIAKDSGLIYIAQNAARHPDSPLEPLFRSLYTANPSFDMSSIDLVTDRNNIRKLLSFVNPKLTGKKGELTPFTISVEVTKNSHTALFCREETKTSEYVGPHEFVGFGHEFEKAYTTSEVDNSTGHHRVISYRLGDLKLITRYETDGYVGAASRTSKLEHEDDLSMILQSLSLSSSSSPSPKLAYAASTGSKLMIRKEGREVPLKSTLEIKTRVSHKPINIQEVLPQLWVSQTPNLVRAYHRGGLFQRPKVEDVAPEIKCWEDEHQVDLKKLVTLIKRIISVAKEHGGNVVVRYDDQIDKLVVWKETHAKRMLPDDLYSRLNDENSGKTEADEKEKKSD